VSTLAVTLEEQFCIHIQQNKAGYY